MRRIYWLAVSLTLFFGLAWPSSARPQSLSVADGVVLLRSGLALRVIRESPTDCLGDVLPVECGSANLITGAYLGVDAAGHAYYFAPPGSATVTSYFGPGGNGYLLQRETISGAIEILAAVRTSQCIVADCSTYRSFHYLPAILDTTNGAIKLPVNAFECLTPGSCNTSHLDGVVEISGLPRLFDTLVTFVPGGQSISALTPTHPDGFRSADSLQAWTGNLRSMPDWSKAQPLACMAAANPLPGQVVSITDTLSDPAVGEGRYYLVASRSGADRRLGRQYLNGAFSARTPASLPVCE